MSITGLLPTPAHPHEAQVIGAFRGGGTLARARLAVVTGLGRSTISVVVARHARPADPERP